ncbi:WD40-repeat-containing domain protein [Dunaliella salina]|uniref:WD40-repeat-containing domain protein n=1 Tax=Dunaliella salina TaxID=3046 RepID=A0ABQ7GJB9_DUNSA|nr:WD40-repeat-containing domain protein [Dunaliella salina]|eukprot:KAF5834708.1 WD40-repeat-containing domain protein [Dunaliella salina]
MSQVKLKKFLLRYYPPGIILQYERDGVMKQKPVDLLDLGPGVDIEALCSQVIKQEPLVSENRRPALRQLMGRLLEKMAETQHHSFSLFKLWDVETGMERASLLGHKAEIVSLNFNTTGDLIITGSFDHDSRIWDVRTGRCVHTLSGHRGEVSSTQFNHAGKDEPCFHGAGACVNAPLCLQVCTCTLVLAPLCLQGAHACVNAPLCLQVCKCTLVLAPLCLQVCKCTLVLAPLCLHGACVCVCVCVCVCGHTDEVLDVAFDAAGSSFVSASADGTARLYNTNTGVCAHTLIGHEGEISKVAYNPQGTRVITASSDKTSRIWDTQTGECLQILEGHQDEIFSCAFNYEGDFIITGSKDNTCRIWKAATATSQLLHEHAVASRGTTGML